MNARAPIYTPDLFCISGELRDAPSVRIRPVMEGGHPMPVLTVVLHKVGPYAKTVVCEQVFPEAAIAAAHARAKQLKPGMHLEVQAPLEMMEVHLHAVAHIRQLDKSKALATAVIKAMEDSNMNAAGDMLTETAVALHVLKMINKDEATRLAAILNLGKVAPHDALQDHAKAHNFPITVAASALVLRDACYQPMYWEYNPDAPRNALLLDMAKHCSVDVEAIKAKVQANIRAATEAAKATASPDKSEAPKANTPLNPAAHTQKGVGGGKAKGKSQQGPAALAGGGGKKLSANAAAASIAAALQALPGEPELGAAAAAQGNVAEPVATDVAQALPPSAGITFATEKTIRENTPAAAGTGESVNDGQDGASAKTGAAVKKAKAVLTAAELVGKVVRINANATQKKQKPWVDYEGTATAQCGPEAVIVSIPRAKGCAPIILSFHVSELDLVAEQEAA